MAPFKLHFSKMSKSRSKESRSSSTDCDDSSCPIQHSSSSRPETPAVAGATGIAGDAADALRNSPPPSYEYVLEETRMKQSVSGSNDRAECDDTEMDERSINEGGNIRNAMQPVGPEILHKSSKELYRAVAKQWGITCKMSDHCRCFDCQSHYFDCEYEKDEHGTDGGLGAGTPMFIAEVIHGTACVLL